MGGRDKRELLVPYIAIEGGREGDASNSDLEQFGGTVDPRYLQGLRTEPSCE